jgi:hypothetical protein
MSYPVHAQGPVTIELSRDVNAAGDYTAKAKFTGETRVIAEAAETTQLATLTAIFTALTTTFPQGDLVATCPITIVNAGVADFNWTT